MDATQQFGVPLPPPHSLNGSPRKTQNTKSHWDSLGLSDGMWRHARRNMDRDTTRYLSAATLLDVDYAQTVVKRIISEPFRALAPAYGADESVVARWAVASLQRRARRDVILTLAVILGLVITVLTFPWPLISVSVIGGVLVFVWLIVSVEYWIRAYHIIIEKMLADVFEPADAPESPYHWVNERIDGVQERRRGNLVVFRGRSAFVGSGKPLSKEHVVIDVSHGRKVKNGKLKRPKKFSNAEVHKALIVAMKKLGFADIHVEERLFVNGRHIRKNRAFLPHGEAAPPATSVAPELLREAALHPTPDARVYVCVEMPAWQGQLVVTLFTRAVHTGGSLYIEWEYYVLPPLRAEFLSIDQRYSIPRSKQFLLAGGWGVQHMFSALVGAPVAVGSDIRNLLLHRRRLAARIFKLEHGQEFDYGAEPSLRQEACGESRVHHFLARDEIMYLLVSQQVLAREIRAFLRKCDVSLGQFDTQIEKITEETHNHYNIHLGGVSDSTVAIGDSAKAKGKG